MDDRSPIGTQVGRFRIEGELGRGGMGVVYRATQVTLGRTVAVKMLSRELATSGEYLARFRREAETLARLAHPNIVHIYDIEETDEAHFIVMEFVDGASLTDVLRREGRLAPGRARDVTVQLARALAAAHRQGIVHRDIKPDNILFTSDGRPKLTDFGIAHMRDSDVKTRTGVMLGTPYYMSPEQAGGRHVTAASDVYSLGVVLYEMLCGRVPFTADTPIAVALKHLREPPPPLRRRSPGLPAGLCRVVERALEKEPSRRYPSADAFRGALEAWPPAPAPATAPAAPGSGSRPTGPARGRSAAATMQRLREGWAELGGALDRSVGVARSAADAAVASAGSAADGVARLVRRAGRAVSRVAEGPVPAPRITGLLSDFGERLSEFRPRRVSLLLWLGAALLGLGFLLAGLRGLAAPPGAKPGGFAGLGPPPEGRAMETPPPDRSPSRTSASIRRPPAGRADGGSGAPGEGTPGDAAGPAPEESGRASRSGGKPDSAADPGAAGVGGAAGPSSSTGEGAVATEGAGGAKEGGGTAGDGSGVEEAAARDEIEAVIERQRVATESGDLALFLSDVAAELRDPWGEEFRKMHEAVTEVRSRIRDIEVAFPGADRAEVSFRVRLTARRREDGRRVTLHDGPVSWRLARTEDRWTIVWSTG